MNKEQEFDLRNVVTALEHIITEMDIDLQAWQGHLDMVSLAGVGISKFELWTNDDPPKKVTPANVEETLIDKKPVRVMHRINGQWDQIGTAEIDPRTGALSASITKPIPEITVGILKDFTINSLGGMVFSSAYQALASTPGSGVVEIPRVGIPEPQTNTGVMPDLDIDNHEFFKGYRND
jgi:hypothetical protein